MASTAERLRELETFAAAFANFRPAEERGDSPGSGASGLWPEEEAVIFPMLRARDLREYYEAKLRIFQDKALLERLLRKLLAHGESIAAPTGTTEIARTLDRNINRTDFLSPAARELFRDGLRQFRRYVDAVRRAGGYKFEFNREQWIFNYAYILFAWTMVILNGHRPTSDDVPAEVARSFRNIMAGAAEAMEAVADRRPIDVDLVEDHLDAELLRAQEVLHPEDFAGGKSLREVLDATS